MHPCSLEQDGLVPEGMTESKGLSKLPEAVEAREGEEVENRVGKGGGGGGGGGAEKEEEMEKWIWALYVGA